MPALIKSGKQLLLSLFFCCVIFNLYSQNVSWMLGTWKGSKDSYTLHIASKTIEIDSADGNTFKGIKTTETDDRNRPTIITTLTGTLDNSNIHVALGKIIFKRDPVGGRWVDCGSCPVESRLTIVKNNLLLTLEISDCQKGCNGTSAYYKPLCGFDSAMQLHLVKLFGTQADVDAFKPCSGETPPPDETKPDKDSLRNAALIAKRRQQQVADSIKTAQAVASKRRQQVDDSLQIVADAARKKQLQQQEDSIANAQKLTRIRLQQITDSVQLAEALAKKQQRQLDDSISLAKALALKEQQRMADSINIAKARMADSLNRAKELAAKEQKRISDSISRAKLTAMKRQQQVDDSVRNAVNLAIRKQKQQQQDSIKNVQTLARLKQQQAEDAAGNAMPAKALPAANPPAITVSTKKDSAKLVATTNAFNTRTNVLLENYHISTPDILVELFDNAEIDGDKVSVFHNGTLIVNNKTLTKEAITFTIHADNINRQHEFVMVAENLGSIPPNTALMRITVGKQRYTLGVKTDLSTNAKIVFYYDGN